MTLLSRAKRRSTAIAAAAALTLSLIAIAPSAAQAADPKVCITGKVPTTATQPWYNFAHSDNSVWAVQNDFTRLAAEFNDSVTKLGAPRTQAQVDIVAEAFSSKFQAWYYKVQIGAMVDAQIALYELSGDLLLATSPATAEAAEIEIGTKFGTIVQPKFAALTSNSGALNTYLTTYFDRLTNTPLNQKISIPSSASSVAALNSTAKAVDKWLALGTPKIKYGKGKPECITTASLSVPSASTSYGKGKTVTITATKSGNAAKGDYAVLVDGKRVGTVNSQSSFAVPIPENLSVGKHVLTVAFAPSDGSPLSTKSSTFTVKKAKTNASVKLSSKKIAAGKKATARITVSVPGTSVKASGKVTVSIGSKSYTGKVKNGKAKVSLGTPAAGKYTVKATFKGGKSLKSSKTKKVTLTVRG